MQSYVYWRAKIKFPYLFRNCKVYSQKRVNHEITTNNNTYLLFAGG